MNQPQHLAPAYEQLAKRLARALLHSPTDTALVVALCGPAVSGKTRLAERVEQQLSEQQPMDAPRDRAPAAAERIGDPYYNPGHDVAQADAGDSGPIIVHFNPWYYSTQKQLLGQFFRELSATAKSKSQSFQENIGGLLDAYAALLSPLSVLLPQLRAVSAFRSIQGLLDSSSEKIKQLGALHKTYTELAKRLGGQKRKLIVVMDDIDRLTPAEIRQVVQLVHRVGDLPNLAYLLVFDPAPVRKALARTVMDDADPLERFVHLGVQVPSLQPQEREQILHHQINDVIRKWNSGSTDEEELPPQQLKPLHPLFRGLRDVVHFSNELRFAISTVPPGGVNPLDFVVATALRVFEQELYAAVYANPRLLISKEALPRLRQQPPPVLASEDLSSEKLLKLGQRLNPEQCRTLLEVLRPKHSPRPGDARSPDGFAACFGLPLIPNPVRRSETDPKRDR